MQKVFIKNYYTMMGKNNYASLAEMQNILSGLKQYIDKNYDDVKDHYEEKWGLSWYDLLLDMMRTFSSMELKEIYDASLNEFRVESNNENPQIKAMLLKEYRLSLLLEELLILENMYKQTVAIDMLTLTQILEYIVSITDFKFQEEKLDNDYGVILLRESFENSKIKLHGEVLLEDFISAVLHTDVLPQELRERIAYYMYDTWIDKQTTYQRKREINPPQQYF